ncbi:MAG: RagB/SusD family nutrient uptake outer membrane protein [Ferruginibacter sp.]|nr:RagB/SusD family nutrient uptake outer membrane protein [Ferruginibacter sp.]
MKYKILIIALFATVMLAESCKKSFLDVAAQGQIDEAAVLKDPAAAQNLVTGVYNSLYQGGFGPTTLGFLYFVTVEEASDDADPGSIPGDNAGGEKIDGFTADANVFYFDNLWRGYYVGINQANKALDILNKASFDAAIVKRLKGEVSYLRGMYYFNLVRLFGGVPKIVTIPGVKDFQSDSLVTRVSKEEIYTLIISDLQFAVDNLPVKGDGNTQVGRANKAAAEGMLAKVYMYQQNWQKVYDLTADVVSSGLYSLVKNKADTLTDFNIIFRERASGNVGGNNNTESVFEVQTGVNVGENAVSPLYSNGQGPRGKGGWDDLGFGWNTPSLDLANAYEAGDTRKTGTIIFVQPTVNAGGAGNTGTTLWDGFRIPSQDSVANQRYNYKGYSSVKGETPQTSGSKDTKPKNIRVMRYAEILLMNAEAAVKLSKDALTPLNMIRNRAGLSSLAVATVNDVWKERRAELAMEQDRFFDLVRQGRAGPVLRALGKPFVDGKHEVFPIPQAEIDLSNGKLKQNPGYN